MTEVEIEIVEPGRSLALVGRLDVHSAPVARAALHLAVEQGDGELVVHLDAAEIWDASGLGVLVGAHRCARRHQRSLVLAGLSVREVRLLRATRLSRVLQVREELTTPDSARVGARDHLPTRLAV